MELSLKSLNNNLLRNKNICIALSKQNIYDKSKINSKLTLDYYGINTNIFRNESFTLNLLMYKIVSEI